jgi:hypothetical protein
MFQLRYAVAVLLFITLLLAGCGGPPPINSANKASSNVTVAQGDNDFVLTAETLYDRLFLTKLVPQGGQVPPEEARAFLDTLLLDTLTGKAADEINLSDHYLDRWTYRLRYHDFLLKTFFDEQVRYRIDADSAEILDFYNQHLDLFSYPAQVQLSHILLTGAGLLVSDDSSYFKALSPEALEDTVRNLAYGLYDSLQGGADFGDLAMRYSHDEVTNKKYGYLGWTTRGQYIDPFDSVAFNLNPKQAAEPYLDRDGWHLLYIEDKMAEGPVSLERDGVWDGVKTTLVNVRADSMSNLLLDSLHRAMTIEYNEPLLDTNAFLVDDSQWAGIANGRDTIDFRFLKNTEQTYRGRFKVANTTPEMKRAMIQEVGLRFTIVKAVSDLRLDTLAYVRRERATLEHNTRKSIMERKRFDPSWKPSDSTVDAFYYAHIDRYQFDQPYNVDRIVVNDSVLAVYLRDLAESGYEFTGLVDEYIPEGQGLTGRYETLGWIGSNDIDSALMAVIQRTPFGGVSRPAFFNGEWQLFRVREARQEQSLFQARGAIVSNLVRDYRQAALKAELASLMAKFGVTVNDKLPAFFLPPVSDRLIH